MRALVYVTAERVWRALKKSDICHLPAPLPVDRGFKMDRFPPCLIDVMIMMIIIIPTIIKFNRMMDKNRIKVEIEKEKLPFDSKCKIGIGRLQ